MIECSPQVRVSHPYGLPLLPAASTNPALDCVNTIPYIRFNRQARWIEFCRFVKSALTLNV